MIDYITEVAGDKKIIAIGNPPYQENYKNSIKNTGANSVYHLLLNHIIESGKIDQFLMVIPSRWFAGGRGKKIREFAEKMRNSKQVKTIHDFKNPKEVFPTVEVKGGVCFVHWDSNYQGNTKFYSSDSVIPEVVDLSETNVIIRDKISRGIVKKVLKKETESIASIAWSWNTFGLASNYFEKNSESKSPAALKCKIKNGGVKKIHPSKIKNSDKVKSYKVAYPKAAKTAGIPYSPDQIVILGKNEVCTETFMIVEAFSKKRDAELLAEYLKTDFVRFLVSLKKITQDVTKETWSLVPILKLKKWDNSKLYKHFGLSKKEIEFIETTCKGW